jgi:hypothetical protein
VSARDPHQQVFSTGAWWDIDEVAPGVFRRRYVPDNEYWDQQEPTRRVRQFASGATRDGEDGKLDYEGFLSPLVLERFARYMHKHRAQGDGKLRDSDNWQKGIPLAAYMKSGWRHFMDWWQIHRGKPWGRPAENEALEDALCALLFNVQGYLHELLSERERA